MIQQSSIEAPPFWQVDPTRVKRVGVLCGPVLVTLGHTRADADDWSAHNIAGETLAGIIERAVVEQCGALWLLPVSGVEPQGSYDAPWMVYWDDAARGCVQLPNRMPDYPLTFHELSQKNRIAGLVAQRRRGGMPLAVYATWRNMWNVAGVFDQLPIEPMQRARAFACGVRLAAYALEAQLRFSPSYTGLQILRQTLAKKPYEIPQLSEWARDLVMEHRPTYVQWCRPITPREAFTFQHGGRVAIHKYDRNSSFVASAGEVPVGDPVHTAVYVPGKPALYQVEVMSDPAEAAHQTRTAEMPGVFHVGEGAGSYPLVPQGRLWAWEPQVRLALSLGLTVRITDGWYWPQKHDLFRVWRERLWLARTQAEQFGGPVGAVAKAIIKRIGVATIGRLKPRELVGQAVMQLDEARRRDLTILDHEVDDWGELTGSVHVEAPLGKVDLVQPHWWSTIIANANERAMAAGYAHVAGVPVGAYVDAWYCLAPWAPGDVEPQRLGKWKLERKTLLGTAQVEALNRIASDPARDGAYTWVSQLARFAGMRDDEL